MWDFEKVGRPFSHGPHGIQATLAAIASLLSQSIISFLKVARGCKSQLESGRRILNAFLLGVGMGWRFDDDEIHRTETVLLGCLELT